MFQGRYRFAGLDVEVLNKPPWQVDPPSPEWAAEASSFVWLRDFRADGGEAARRGARELVRSWLECRGEWDAIAWRPDVLGRRLLAWCSHADFVLDGAETPFRRAFHLSLARQQRHLQRAWPLAPSGGGGVAALAGLAATQACTGWPRRTRALHWRLDSELRSQVLGDGCHASRNPSTQLRMLRELLWLQASLVAAEVPVPRAVNSAIDHMGPMLRLLCHGDGALGSFHGGNEEDRTVVAETLAVLPGRGRQTGALTTGGFARMTAGPALVLVDAGPPPAHGFAADAHASPLAFEFSIGRERLVVNCGHAPAGDWRQASRATAAHSTLVLGNTNSTELHDRGVGARPQVVIARHQENDGNLWLDVEHDGYAERFGLYHHRRLYLAADGTTLRGADIIDGPGRGEARPPFAVRFHLDPGVRATQVADGALLRLPGGTGWRFRAAGGDVSLAESRYLAQGGKIRSTEQIILSGAIAVSGAHIKWAFSRIAPAH